MKITQIALKQIILEEHRSILLEKELRKLAPRISDEQLNEAVHVFLTEGKIATLAATLGITVSMLLGAMQNAGVDKADIEPPPRSISDFSQIYKPSPEEQEEEESLHQRLAASGIDIDPAAATSGKPMRQIQHYRATRENKVTSSYLKKIIREELEVILTDEEAAEFFGEYTELASTGE